MTAIEFSVLVKADFKVIWNYVSERSGDDAADRVLNDIVEKCEVLARNPLIGKNQDEILVNLRSFPHKRYVIFYFPIENGVEIYRVVHSSRDIESIFTDYFEDLGE